MTEIGKWFLMIFMTGLIALVGINPRVIYAAEQNKNNTEPYSNGAKLWANTCARCHNMRSVDEFRPDQWRVIMAHMRIRAQLTGQETHEILMFLTRQADAKTEQITAKQDAPEKIVPKKIAPPKLSGKTIYLKNCAACHGANGKGVIPDAPDMSQPNGPLSKPYHILLNNTEKGIGNMPPKGGNPNLSHNEIKEALGYMINAFKQRQRGQVLSDPHICPPPRGSRG